MDFPISIRNAIAGLLDSIYPNVCFGCGEYIKNQEKAVCHHCLDQIDYLENPLCIQCGNFLESKNNCKHCGIDNPVPVLALGQYIDPLKELIHQFKFQKIRKLGKQFGSMIVEKHGQSILASNADILVPVPLHSYRLKSRGFNQAHNLAAFLGNQYDIGVDAHSILKKRKTKDQVRLGAKKRRENLHNIFDCTGNAISEKKVIMVDDVFTTGATLREMKRVIENSGGKPVMAVVIAVAGV